MKHFAIIHAEFIKIAAENWWDDLSYEQQKSYIRLHPETNKQITSKPSIGSRVNKFLGGDEKTHKNKLELYNDIVKKLPEDKKLDFVKQLRPEDKSQYKREHKRNLDSAHQDFQNTAWKNLRTLGMSPKFTQDAIDHAYATHGDNNLKAVNKHIEDLIDKIIDKRKGL